MKKITAIYNELYYSVRLTKNGETETIYTAGNSPFDSQGYVSASEGVGIEKMKHYAKQTALELAEEYKAKFSGITYELNKENAL